MNVMNVILRNNSEGFFAQEIGVKFSTVWNSSRVCQEFKKDTAPADSFQILWRLSKTNYFPSIRFGEWENLTLKLTFFYDTSLFLNYYYFQKMLIFNYSNNVLIFYLTDSLKFFCYIHTSIFIYTFSYNFH